MHTETTWELWQIKINSANYLGMKRTKCISRNELLCLKIHRNLLAHLIILSGRSNLIFAFIIFFGITVVCSLPHPSLTSNSIGNWTRVRNQLQLLNFHYVLPVYRREYQMEILQLKLVTIRLYLSYNM